MIVLWILLGLIALIFLLLCIPVRFDLNYNGEATVFIRYLFLKYRVLPAPEKKPEPKKEKKPSEKKSEEQAKEKKPNPLLRQVKKYKEAEGLTGLLTLAKDLLKATGTRFGKLLKHIKLKDFDLYVLVGRRGRCRRNGCPVRRGVCGRVSGCVGLARLNKLQVAAWTCFRRSRLQRKGTEGFMYGKRCGTSAVRRAPRGAVYTAHDIAVLQ